MNSRDCSGFLLTRHSSIGWASTTKGPRQWQKAVRPQGTPHPGCRQHREEQGDSERKPTVITKLAFKLYFRMATFVVNISSPNTPDLRGLQHGSELSSLLEAVKNEMSRQAKIHGGEKAVLVKIAPDVSDEELEFMVDTISASGVSGIIATNTTLSRDGLTHSNAKETGGLSGKPARNRSTEIVSRIYKQTGGALPIIGSGGIFTASDAYDKIRAGASLVEIIQHLSMKGLR